MHVCRKLILESGLKVSKRRPGDIGLVENAKCDRYADVDYQEENDWT